MSKHTVENSRDASSPVPRPWKGTISLIGMVFVALGGDPHNLIFWECGLPNDIFLPASIRWESLRRGRTLSSGLES